MKQLRILFFSLAILVATISTAQQSSYYVFTKTSAPYVPLPTGSKTIFQSGSQLNSDATSSEITLPFAFSIYGEPMTKVYLSNNGFVGFGSPPNRTTIYNAISSSETMAKYLISFSNQIIAANIGSPEISYGQNSSGDMVFQFQDVGISTSSTVRFTFQIILKSDESTIQIMFGPNCTGHTPSTVAGQTGRGFECGARGLQVAPSWNPTAIFKNTVAGGYNNTLLIVGDWNKTIFKAGQSGGINFGTQPSSTMNARASNIMPNSGTIYQWTIN